MNERRIIFIELSLSLKRIKWKILSNLTTTYGPTFFAKIFYIWNNAHSLYGYTQIHTLFKCYTQIQFACENTNYLEKNYLRDKTLHQIVGLCHCQN